MLLQIRGINKSFGSLLAVDGVDLEVEEGEIFGIAGPNGAGKSTLFNIIAGLYRPTSGEIIFAGQDITGLKPHQVCHNGIARTFQVPKIFPTMNVYENIRIGGLFGAGRTDLIQGIINMLYLKDYLEHEVGNLDLFTLKRLTLASALATDCRLLLLDEPMAGLSIAEIKKYVRLVRSINQEMNITVIIIEHLLDTLVDISQRLMILHNGQVIYCGDPQKMAQDGKVRSVYVGKGEPSDAA